MRAGAEGQFEDLFRARWHYRALNGDFGADEQAHALLAGKTLTAAGILYYQKRGQIYIHKVCYVFDTFAD
jgi:hypothetical protein